ncbi:dTDP-4-dehydrorhamnose 3,5-epimerase [Colwellia sp. 4_MG-2023]|uniref:dTDP-4-dehydrorhamnose 3,5-epimerase n=1 Tax=unclassified Colwellia TaxID=196834 RepID=UPI0026E37400|nr:MULTISPECIES: dTDP-4-dehydrorhamnose 3,5-epimerase [unclassified Colwellia]MDO6506827.1 dTDP-4-dehydrorhamnose 3,5-epimerase [Colwellia sp. 5_MG-2023]MDO6555798.1 dTDP-4-dehydrorhamnose 3,5-epimerase [Colwellia sp. 4_MG-2023]
MKYIETAIPDVKIIESNVFGDERGFFMETFRVDEFINNCAEKTFVQDNHSKSSHGILRGLHYQLQQTQGKLVRVTAGEVYDVAVDMRASSPTYGQHVGVVLSAENKRQLWVPEGFAHGFYVMSESAEFVYKCTNYYSPEHEVSLLWNDADLAIEWPLVDNIAPLLSAKDKDALPFAEAPTFK